MARVSSDPAAGLVPVTPDGSGLAGAGVERTANRDLREVQARSKQSAFGHRETPRPCWVVPGTTQCQELASRVNRIRAPALVRVRHAAQVRIPADATGAAGAAAREPAFLPVFPSSRVGDINDMPSCSLRFYSSSESRYPSWVNSLESERSSRPRLTPAEWCIC